MRSVEELNAIKNKYISNVKIRTSDYETRIIVGMGNSGLVAGARDILKFFVKRIEEEGLNGKVIVTVEMAERIIEEHIKGGKIIDEYILAEDSDAEV